MPTNDKVKLSVLSIDFDYFQETDAYTMATNYPDGVDISTDLSCLIWAGHYARKPTDPKDESLIDKVSINGDLIRQLIQIIRNQKNEKIPVCVCNSHVHIYQELLNKMDDIGRDRVYLYIDHIDMHHDYENGNEDVDCGNWISKIQEEHGLTYVRWHARKLGCDMFKTRKIRPFSYDSLTSILDSQYDYIFLCRSDNWSPPHLDEYFEWILRELSNKFDNSVYAQACVLQPRSMAYIMDRARDQERFMQKAYEESKR